MPPIEREVTASVSKPMAWMPGPKRMAAAEAKRHPPPPTPMRSKLTAFSFIG